MIFEYTRIYIQTSRLIDALKTTVTCASETLPSARTMPKRLDVFQQIF